MCLQTISGRCMLIQRMFLQSNSNFILCSCSLHKKNHNSVSFCDVVNVELIDKCIRSLKLDEAYGPDELSAEQLVHAHPSLVIHLCFLFRSMVMHGFVSDKFDAGLIVSLVKDKQAILMFQTIVALLLLQLYQNFLKMCC